MTLVSCSPPASSQRPVQPATPALRSRVPPADPSKYRSVLDARDWQNPYLVVHANGIDARPISSETEAPRMSPAEVVGYLEKLPSIAWPYGLVVVVQESGVRAPGDNAQIRKNAEELQRLLAENWGESGIVAFGLERASTRLQLSDLCVYQDRVEAMQRRCGNINSRCLLRATRLTGSLLTEHLGDCSVGLTSHFLRTVCVSC